MSTDPEQNVNQTQKVYFDTDAARAMSSAYSDNNLPEDLTSHLIFSPVTLMELLSQLTINSSDQVLAGLRSLKNWNTKIRILPSRDHLIRAVVFSDSRQDPLVEELAKFLKAVFRGLPVDHLKLNAMALRDEMDEDRKSVLSELENMTAKFGNLPSEELFEWAYCEFLELQFNMTLKRDPRILFDAYLKYEYEVLKVSRTPGFSFKSRRNLNRLNDSRQLLYLSLPDLHFVSFDRGYECLGGSSQRDRIHIFKPNDFSTAAQIERQLDSVLLK
jgi:hypothetical protein